MKKAGSVRFLVKRLFGGKKLRSCAKWLDLLYTLKAGVEDKSKWCTVPPNKKDKEDLVAPIPLPNWDT